MSWPYLQLRPCRDDVPCREDEVKPDDGHMVSSKFLKPEQRGDECDNERGRQDPVHHPLGLVLFDTINFHETLLLISRDY
jgi:hypothetical protein